VYIYIIHRTMSKSFQSGAFSAGRAFIGTDKPANAGDYIVNLKSKALYRSLYTNRCIEQVVCSNNCQQSCEECSLGETSRTNSSFQHKKKQVFKTGGSKNGANSYDYMLNVKRGYIIDQNVIDNVPPFSKTDIVNGLYSSSNLTNVTTIAKGINVLCDNVLGVSASPCEPLYQNYRVDPDGDLFGASPCGVNHYISYVELEK